MHNAIDMLNYKFHLYPMAGQEFVLEQTLDGCRWEYNYFPDRRISKDGGGNSDGMQGMLTESMERHPRLRNRQSKVSQAMGMQSIITITSARMTAEGKPLSSSSLPSSYRNREDFNSFIHSQNGFRADNKGLMLPKIGTTRIALHRQPINEGC